MKYILKHKMNKVYLKYYKYLNWNHYVADVKEASLFDKRQANIRLKKFKHPENWEIIEIKERGLRK